MEVATTVYFTRLLQKLNGYFRRFLNKNLFFVLCQVCAHATCWARTPWTVTRPIASVTVSRGSEVSSATAASRDIGECHLSPRGTAGVYVSDPARNHGHPWSWKCLYFWPWSTMVTQPEPWYLMCLSMVNDLQPWFYHGWRSQGQSSYLLIVNTGQKNGTFWNTNRVSSS